MIMVVKQKVAVKVAEVKSNGCAEPNDLQEGREAERIEDERAGESRNEHQLAHIRKTRWIGISRSDAMAAERR